MSLSVPSGFRIRTAHDEAGPRRQPAPVVDVQWDLHGCVRASALVERTPG